MTVSSDDYATVVAACRFALAHGSDIKGRDINLILDVVQHAANTLDTQASADILTANTDADAEEALLVTLAADVATAKADADALEAALVTAFAAWDGAGAGDSSTANADAHTACDPLRTALIASAAAADTAATAVATPRATAVTSMNTLVANAGVLGAVVDITPDDILDGRHA